MLFNTAFFFIRLDYYYYYTYYYYYYYLLYLLRLSYLLVIVLIPHPSSLLSCPILPYLYSEIITRTISSPT